MKINKMKYDYRFICLMMLVFFMGLAGCDEFIVTKTADTNDGACTADDCSLREAIIAANDNPGFDLILMPDGVYKLSLGSANEDNAKGGDLDITDSVSIRGTSQNNTIIDGNDLDRVFDIHAGSVSMNQLTIQNGKVNSGGAGIHVGNDVVLAMDDATITGNQEYGPGNGSNMPGAGWGGAIYSTGDLILTNVIIADNFNLAETATVRGGGGIAAFGARNGSQQTGVYAKVSLTRVTFEGNVTNKYGGGLACMDYVLADITDCRFESNKAGTGGAIYSDYDYTEMNIAASVILNNRAEGSGGGIRSSNKVHVIDTTIDGNSAGYDGGGLYIAVSTVMGIPRERVFIEKSTVSNNSADNMGGGIMAVGGFESENVTISNNRARVGGGVALYNSYYYLTNATIAFNNATECGGGVFLPISSILYPVNTIIARNTVASDLCNCDPANQLESLGNNLSDDETCLLTNDYDIIAGPFLGSLRNNGGPTKTHAIPFYSPAVDAGNNQYAPSRDQRGKSRPFGLACDIGAYEWVQPSSHL